MAFFWKIELPGFRTLSMDENIAITVERAYPKPVSDTGSCLHS